MKSDEEKAKYYESIGGAVIGIVSRGTSQEQIGRDVVALVNSRQEIKLNSLNNRVNIIEEKLGEAGFSIDAFRTIVETQAKTKWFEGLVKAQLSKGELGELRNFLNALQTGGEKVVTPEWKKLIDYFKHENIPFEESEKYFSAFLTPKGTACIDSTAWNSCYAYKFDNIYFFIKDSNASKK